MQWGDSLADLKQRVKGERHYIFRLPRFVCRSWDQQRADPPRSTFNVMDPNIDTTRGDWRSDRYGHSSTTDRARPRRASVSSSVFHRGVLARAGGVAHPER